MNPDLNYIIFCYDKAIAELNRAIKNINDKLWELENRVEELEEKVLLGCRP